MDTIKNLTLVSFLLSCFFTYQVYAPRDFQKGHDLLASPYTSHLFGCVVGGLWVATIIFFLLYISGRSSN